MMHTRARKAIRAATHCLKPIRRKVGWRISYLIPRKMSTLYCFAVSLRILENCHQHQVITDDGSFVSSTMKLLIKH